MFSICILPSFPIFSINDLNRLYLKHNFFKAACIWNIISVLRMFNILKQIDFQTFNIIRKRPVLLSANLVKSHIGRQKFWPFLIATLLHRNQYHKAFFLRHLDVLLQFVMKITENSFKCSLPLNIGSSF